jgi:cytochrome c oxidase subunit 4
MNWFPPRVLVISWVALLALLGTTVFAAYQPLGSFNLFIALLIATTKASIVAAVFMELRERSGLTIAFAAAGFFWLGILIWLSGIDFMTRPELPSLTAAPALLRSP